MTFNQLLLQEDPAKSCTINDGIKLAKEVLAENIPYILETTISGVNSTVIFNDHFLGKMMIALTDGRMSYMSPGEKDLFFALVEYQDMMNNPQINSNEIVDIRVNDTVFTTQVLSALDEWLVLEAQELVQRGINQYWDPVNGWVEATPTQGPYVRYQGYNGNQEWSSMTSVMSLEQTYQNLTQGYIEVNAIAEYNGTDGESISFKIDNVVRGTSSVVTSTSTQTVLSFIVPVGSTYEINSSTVGQIALLSWSELRYV